VRVTFLLWRGNIGGAERITVALAGELRRAGIDTSALFVCGEARLASQLALEGVPHASLGLGRGGELLGHPARLRRALRRLAPDVVVTVAVGYIGAVARAAGFRGPIIGVEHGSLIPLTRQTGLRGAPRWLDRLSGVVTYDAEVAISQYMLDLVEQGPHARRLALIPHGIRVGETAPPLPGSRRGGLTAGFAGRLVRGKGVDRLLAAVARLARPDLRLRVAGDGPMREPWERMARDLGIADRVEFAGWTDDIGGHWAQCDLGVAPNDEFHESFCISALEAMGSGRPTLVTDIGALPELVLPRSTGQIVPRGDEGALSDALAGYLAAPDRCAAEGAAAHERAIAHYSLTRSAQRYATLAEELLEARAR
jgi:glycosyltransferase involved in cell wall biosynthesis